LFFSIIIEILKQTTKKTVINRKPVALFSKKRVTVKVGETITFDASGSYDPDDMIVTYAWDFGDGNTGNGVTTKHVYIEDGTYTVTLNLTDDDGDSASVTADKTVKTQEVMTLAVLSVIGLGVAALTATFLYGLYVRKKKNPLASLL
jgi:PKD repeat protein